MPKQHRPAFTALELLITAAVGAVGLCILASGAGRARCASQLTSSTANLERIATLSASYNADFQDRTPVFSWRGGAVPPSQYADLRSVAQTGNDQVAASAQAVDIIRRRSAQTSFPIVNNWIPHISYWHLTLADYGAAKLPEFDLVSPADAVQLAAARSSAQGERTAFASSYEMNPFFWQPERAVGGTSYSGVQQSSTHSTFFSQFSQNGILGPRSVANILFPAQKAYVYDKAQRHFAPTPIYFAYPQSRVLVLGADAHVATQHAGECTRGFAAQNPRSILPLTYSYQPGPGEPPIPSDSGTNVYGVLRWTRGGLDGRDFGGVDINTSAW